MDPRRFWGIALVLWATAHADTGGQQGVRVLVQSSPLAGFHHYAGVQVWRELRVGDVLELAREPDNPHDPNAVAVRWRGHKLGYVPRRENAALAWGLDRGTPLRARISDLAEHPNPARRVRFDVYVE